MVLSLIVYSVHTRNDRNKNWYAVLRNPVHPKSVMHFLSYFSNFPFDLIGFSGKFRSGHKLYVHVFLFFFYSKQYDLRHQNLCSERNGKTTFTKKNHILKQKMKCLQHITKCNEFGIV